jgi:FtsH-binding integral membrane protein
MNEFDRVNMRSIPQQADMSIDVGLRRFMLGVYNKLGLGLVLTAALSFVTSADSPIRDVIYRVTEDGRLAGMTGVGMALQFAPLVVLLGAMFGMRNPSPKASGILYWTIVSLIGASSGVWMLLYTGGSVVNAFLASAIAFGGLSLVGYTTKKDLTGFGSFLSMGLIGLIAVSLLNAFFIHASGLALIVNIVGVFIFAGLTAYDTQRLKMTYYALGGDEASMAVATNFGALNLYLNFINLFQMLLSLFGSRR